MSGKNPFLGMGFGSPFTKFARLVSGGASVISDGLLMHLDAGNTNSYSGSGSTWTDLSGNGNNATFVPLVGAGGPTYNSGNGGYFDFDGANDYVNVSSNTVLPYGTNPFTFSVWIYIDVISGSWGPNFKSCLLFSGDTFGRVECGIFAAGNTAGPPSFIKLARYGGGTSGTCEVNVSMNTSAWYNVTIVRDGVSSQKIYQDGVQIGTGNVSNSFIQDDMKMFGGTDSGGNFSGFHDGRVANVLMYNKALTASEVLQNYNALKGRYS